MTTPTMTFIFWVVTMPSIVGVNKQTPRRPGDPISYVIVGLEYRPVPCDQEGQSVKTIDNIPMCTCPEGKYLHMTGSGVSECVNCSLCDPSGSRYLQRLACGMYNDTVCCQSPSNTPVKRDVSDYPLADCPNKAGYYPKHRDGYIRVAKYLKTISCTKRFMIRQTMYGMTMCVCIPGYFLQSRNIHDERTARCVKRHPCNPKGSRPYERQQNGMYSDTICCPHQNMTVEMTGRGFFHCVMPTSKPVVDKPVQPECDEGFFLQNETGCVPCTVCSDHEDTPYESRPCSNTSDTVCCARNDSIVQDTESGIECVPPIPDTIRAPIGGGHPNKVPKDDGLEGCNESVCICPDGSVAHVTDGHLDCKETKATDHVNHDYYDDENGKKEKYPRLFWMCVVIFAMVLMLIPCYMIHKRRIKSFFGNNRYFIEQQARKKEKMLNDTDDIEMQPIRSPTGDDAAG